MKVTLDISKLLDEGKISQREYDIMLQLASKDTNDLVINILVGFGVVAITIGIIAFNPSLLFLTMLSLIFIGSGLFIILKYRKQWNIVGNILLLIGALGSAILLLERFEETTLTFSLITIIFLTIGTIAKSGLLISLSALSIAPLIQERGIEPETYLYQQPEATLTIILYGLLSCFTYFLSTKFRPQYARLASIFSKTSLIIVNLSFFIGSLVGDKILDLTFDKNLFAFIWTVMLISTGIWAAKKEKKFVVNTVATFGAIHFYVQWFDKLGAEAGSIFLGGIIAIVIAIGLWKYNKK